MKKRIADYELVDVLGEGNHGRFYLAVPPARLGLDTELVAVKVLDQHASDDGFRRVSNELKLFVAARSPHLVRLHDAGFQSHRLYYSMEYLPGGSLAAPTQPLTQHDVLRAVAHAARGTHALHELGVAHRDVKPSNVLLVDGGARLSDLGLAQVLSPGQTVTGIGPIGTIEYMDPSVALGERASRATDIWSLGATLHKSLTGKSLFREFPADVVRALRYLISTEPEIYAELDPQITDTIRRCLAPDHSERFATAELLADRLDELVATTADIESRR